ncbi:Enolase [Candidatus Tiddalikarchaeum anstoanum]|nr:Enolase [Candidatus Tiddalikarchaeum anstoanum]
MKITHVNGFWILDSRGNPTITTIVKTKESIGVASVPSGASKGEFEAVELRDNAKAFNGKGVMNAIRNINTVISKELLNMDVTEQELIDSAMISLDGTPNKSKLGANAILSVSMAAARCAASFKNQELYRYLGGMKGFPTPLMNVINGGKHAGNNLNVQECMIIPDTPSFETDIQAASEIYQSLKKIIEKKYGKNATNVGDEGGFAPPITDIEDAFSMVLNAIEENGYGKEVKLGMDVAASEFFSDNYYNFQGKNLRSDQLSDYYIALSKKYPLVSIEDPFEQNDFESFAVLNKALRGKVQIVGDDLLVTNVERLKKSIQENSCSALLLKVNQIGTLTEAKKAAVLAHKNNMNVIMSHRSGETCDDFIADLCLGWGCEQLKAGAPARGERVSKYNRLLMLEQMMKK